MCNLKQQNGDPMKPKLYLTFCDSGKKWKLVKRKFMNTPIHFVWRILSTLKTKNTWNLRVMYHPTKGVATLSAKIMHRNLFPNCMIIKRPAFYYKQKYSQENMPINMCKFFILLHKFDKISWMHDLLMECVKRIV